MSCFILAVTGCTFACICHTAFRVFSCLQINWQPFYLRQLLKFHPFDWLIESYLQIEGQGTHHKMVSLQPMFGFPLCCSAPVIEEFSSVFNEIDKVRDFSLNLTLRSQYMSEKRDVPSTDCLRVQRDPRVILH